MRVELEIAARQLRLAVTVFQHFEGSVIPQHYAARAIVPFRDVALEVAVAERVILDVHRKLLGQWNL